MKVALEFLYHCCCDFCEKWWSIADITPIIGEKMFCPHCGARNPVEQVNAAGEAKEAPDRPMPPYQTGAGEFP